MPASVWYELAPSWLFIAMISFAVGRVRTGPPWRMRIMLGERRLALHAAAALNDHEGLEALFRLAAKDIDRGISVVSFE